MGLEIVAVMPMIFEKWRTHVQKKLMVALFAVTLLTTGVHAAELEPIHNGNDVAVVVTETTPIISQDRIGAGILPRDIQVRTELGVDLLVKTLEVEPDASLESLVEQNLERGGIAYTLREILREEQPAIVTHRQAFQTVTISAQSDRREDILSLLAGQIEYNSGGYSGWLQLDESSISTEVESTRDSTRAISETRMFSGLVRNDPYLISRTIEHGGITLGLMDIQWGNTNPNEPNPTFTATATYTGRIRSQVPDSFLVTARYAGYVTREVPGNVVYTIIYEPTRLPDIACAGGAGSFDFGSAVRIASIVAGIGGIVAAAVILSKKLPLIKGRRDKNKRGQHILPEDEPQPRPARRKPHALGYMKRDTGAENA